jgi:hypothetical protein
LKKISSILLKNKNFFLLLLIGFTLFSCKSKQKIEIDYKKNEYLKSNKLYELVTYNELKYNTLNMKLSVQIISNNFSKDEFTGIVRIKKDSIIWISFRSLNIEGARICITKDSVRFINRINDSYFTENFSSFANHFKLDIDYNILQSILTNSFFFYPCCSDDSEKIDNFKLCSDKDYYCISSLSRRETSKYFSKALTSERWNKKLEKEISDSSSNNHEEDYEFQIVKIIPEIFKIANVFLENYIDKQSLYISYDKQILVNKQIFPEVIKVELETPQLKSDITLNISNVYIDQNDQSYPFKINTKNTKIEFK